MGKPCLQPKHTARAGSYMRVMRDVHKQLERGMHSYYYLRPPRATESPNLVDVGDAVFEPNFPEWFGGGVEDSFVEVHNERQFALAPQPREFLFAGPRGDKNATVGRASHQHAHHV